jgi:hypothetical protein
VFYLDKFSKITRMKYEIILLVILILALPVQAKHLHLEKEYQTCWCYGIIEEYCQLEYSLKSLFFRGFDTFALSDNERSYKSPSSV